MANDRTDQVDLRRLSDQDKHDFQKGGGYGEQVSALKRARAYQGNMAYAAKRQEKTTTQTPGTGGMSPGIGIQQERYREIGRENEAAKGNRPDLENSMYDIYS